MICKNGAKANQGVEQVRSHTGDMAGSSLPWVDGAKAESRRVSKEGPTDVNVGTPLKATSRSGCQGHAA